MPFCCVTDESTRREEVMGKEIQKGAESEGDDLGTFHTGLKQVTIQQYLFIQFGLQQRAFIQLP